MRIHWKIILFFSLLLFSGIIRAQDSVTRSMPEFRNINVIGKMRVELYRSDKPGVEITVSNTSADNVITEVKDSTLSIRLKTDTNKTAGIRVLVKYSRLSELSVAADALLVSPETLTENTLSFTARSGAKMELDLNLSDLKAEVKQGAILVFRGNTKRQDVVVSTGATYSAYRMKADDTYVKTGTGSKAKVCAARILDADANTKSYIGYIGTPVSVLMKTNLGGSIEGFATEDAIFGE